MVDVIFKAFLSCSFAQEDQETIDFFKKIIRSFDIEPESYDYQEIGRVPEKVKEKIVASDCLIAIATRRKKIEGSEYWSCPDWIQHEVTLASAYNKPIAIFFEDSVKIEGFIGMEERRQSFLRNDFIKDIEKITKFLFKLRNHLESIYVMEKFEIPLLMRHYVHVKEEMISREICVTRCEVLMESLVPELKSTHHSMTLDDTTPGLSIKCKQFEFVCIEKPAGMNVQTVVVQDTDQKWLWKILFDPPLKQGERVRYAFKVVRPNYRPYTLEEMMERIRQGTYEYKEPICEACEWHLSYPTAELNFSFEFPEGYEIKRCYADVKIGEKLRLEAKDETRRIRDGGFFTAEKIFDKWTLNLKLPKPVQGYIYYTYYEPPKASEIK